jgi:hypothetical protein
MGFILFSIIDSIDSGSRLRSVIYFSNSEANLVGELVRVRGSKGLRDRLGNY